MNSIQLNKNTGLIYIAINRTSGKIYVGQIETIEKMRVAKRGMLAQEAG